MNSNLRFVVSVLILFSLTLQDGRAQDPERFGKEVKQLIGKEHHLDPSKETLLFAGSSSIRKWKNIRDYFPDYNVINNGFGGSQFSDLIYFYKPLIGQYHPGMIFIYEGDNDIAAGKKPSVVFRDAKHLLSLIRKDFPGTPVMFISAKPSVSRWHLRKGYEALNRKLEKFCKRTKNVWFVDVWDIMLDDNGVVRQDIFLKDQLHMNDKGYELWKKQIDSVIKDVKKALLQD